MFEQWQQTVSANTAEADLTRAELKISSGYITRISVYFPFGVEHLARCRVLLGSKPLLPRSKAGYATGNGVLVDTGDIREPTKGNNPVLTWELWNLDDTYTHELTLNVTWLPTLPEESIILEVQNLTKYVRNFIRLLTGGLE